MDALRGWPCARILSVSAITARPSVVYVVDADVSLATELAELDSALEGVRHQHLLKGIAFVDYDAVLLLLKGA